MKKHLFKWKLLLVIAVSLFSLSSVTAGLTERPLVTNENQSKATQVSIIKSSDPDKSYIMKRSLGWGSDCYARYITDAKQLDFDHLAATALINNVKAKPGEVGKGSDENGAQSDSCITVNLGSYNGTVKITFPVGSIKDKISGVSNTTEIVYNYKITTDDQPAIFAKPVRESDILSLSSFKVKWDVPDGMLVDHYALYVATEAMYSQFINYPNYSAERLVSGNIPGSAREYVIENLTNDKQYWFILFGYDADGWRYFCTGNFDAPVYIPKEFKLEISSISIPEKAIVKTDASNADSYTVKVVTTSDVKKESLAHATVNSVPINMDWVSFGDMLDNTGFPIEGEENLKEILFTIPAASLNTGLFTTNTFTIPDNKLQSAGSAIAAKGVTRSFKALTQDEMNAAVVLTATPEDYKIKVNVDAKIDLAKHILTLTNPDDEEFKQEQTLEIGVEAKDVTFTDLKPVTMYTLNVAFVDGDGYTTAESDRIVLPITTVRAPIVIKETSMFKKTLVQTNTANDYYFKYDADVKTILNDGAKILRVSNGNSITSTTAFRFGEDGDRSQIKVTTTLSSGDYLLIIPAGNLIGKDDKASVISDTFYISCAVLDFEMPKTFEKSNKTDSKYYIIWDKAKLTSFDKAELYTKNYSSSWTQPTDVLEEDGKINPYFKMESKGYGSYALHSVKPLLRDSATLSTSEKAIIGYGLKLYQGEYQLYPTPIRVDTTLWSPAVELITPLLSTRLPIEAGKLTVTFSEDITLGNAVVKFINTADQTEVTCTTAIKADDAKCLEISYPALTKGVTYELVFPEGVVIGKYMANKAYNNYGSNYTFKTVSDGAVIEKTDPNTDYAVVSVNEFGTNIVLTYDKPIIFNPNYTGEEVFEFAYRVLSTEKMVGVELDSTYITLDSVSEKIWDETYENVIGVKSSYTATITYNCTNDHVILSVIIPEGFFLTKSNAIPAEGFMFQDINISPLGRVFETLVPVVEAKDITSTSFTPTWEALDFNTWEEESGGGGGVGPLSNTNLKGGGMPGVEAVFGYQVFYSNKEGETFGNLKELVELGQYIRIEGTETLDTVISDLEKDAEYTYLVRGFVEYKEMSRTQFVASVFTSIQTVQLADVAPEILSVTPNSESEPLMLVNDSVDFTLTFSKKIYRDPAVAMTWKDVEDDTELAILTVRDSSTLVEGVHTYTFRLPAAYGHSYAISFPVDAFVDADGLGITEAIDIEVMIEDHPITMVTPVFKAATKIGADKVTINWNKVAIADTMYLYYSKTKIGVNTSAPGISMIKVPADRDNYSIYNLDEETKYFFKLRAYNGENYSRLSESDSIVTLEIAHYALAEAIRLDGDVPEHKDEVIRVKGVVTTPKMDPGISGKDTPFYIQDGTLAGMYIYQRDTNIEYVPTIGDTVIVTGTVAIFNGAVQLSYIKKVVKMGNGPAVAAQTVTEINRDVVGELISIEGLRYVKTNTVWFTDAATLGSGKTYKFANATDTFDIRFIRGSQVVPEPKATEVFTVSGIASIYKSSAPFNSGWQLMPRFPEDIVRTSVIRPAQNAAAFRMYPNPVLDQLSIEVGANAKLVEIIDINGRVVYTQQDPNSKISVDFSQMRSGMYFVRVVNAKGATIQKLVK